MEEGGRQRRDLWSVSPWLAAGGYFLHRWEASVVHGGLQPTAALPGCLPQALLWRGLWGAWWGWAGLAAWPGVTEHSSWGRDKSQGQRHPRQSQGVSVTFGRAVGAGQCHSVPGSCLGVL